jgi:hydrogenase maturation protease
LSAGWCSDSHPFRTFGVTCASAGCSDEPGGDITSRILVAGIGNIFFGDDGFGPEVIQRGCAALAGSDVRVVDYGIRGMHLAYDLLEEWAGLILVDAVPNQGAAGTLHVFEADHEALTATAGLDAHSMDPGAVFASLQALGGNPPYTVVVGCEVDNIDDGMGLSDAVAAAVPAAVRAVESALDLVRSKNGAAVQEG